VAPLGRQADLAFLAVDVPIQARAVFERLAATEGDGEGCAGGECTRENDVVGDVGGDRFLDFTVGADDGDERALGA